jgi:hypothetical protein
VLVAGDIFDPTGSAMHSLRALPRRWLTLAAEIRTHDDVLDDHSARGANVARSIRDWCGLHGRDDVVAGRQSDEGAFRGRVRQALWCVPDSRLERRDASASALSWRPPSSQRGALSHCDRPHAPASTDHGLRRSTHDSGLTSDQMPFLTHRGFNALRTANGGSPAAPRP